MKKINLRHVAYLLILYFLSFFQVVYAAPDVVAQNYAAANSPGIQSCTAGYDLLSGDIAYQQPLISSKLPYSLNYKAPLRLNLSAAQTFAQPENTTFGWSDNYQSSVIIQNIDATSTQYQNYSVQQMSSGFYNLSTSNPITSSFSAKLIIVRLAGETVDTVFKEQDSVFTRLYSADAIRDLNTYTIGQLSWSSDLGEYNLSRIGANLIIHKHGIKYTISSSSYNVAPATTHWNSINLYIDKSGNLRTTDNFWPILDAVNMTIRGALSNTSAYITNKSTVSANLYRVARIDSKGRSLNMQYDGWMNLSQVTDNYNNKLILERKFHETTAGATQTVDESRLVTKVSYANAGQAASQVAEFKYQSYDVTTPSTGVKSKVYALIESNSTAAGKNTYVNSLTELGAMKAFVGSKGRTADASYHYPVLKQVKNALAQVVR